MCRTVQCAYLHLHLRPRHLGLVQRNSVSDCEQDKIFWNRDNNLPNVESREAGHCGALRPWSWVTDKCECHISPGQQLNIVQNINPNRSQQYYSSIDTDDIWLDQVLDCSNIRPLISRLISIRWPCMHCHLRVIPFLSKWTKDHEHGIGVSAQTGPNAAYLRSSSLRFWAPLENAF